jgi:transposase-like protein
MRRQYTAEERERLLEEIRKTGDGVKVVAARLGVSTSAAYAWVGKARRKLLTAELT